jgi:hypothetical protein
MLLADSEPPVIFRGVLPKLEDDYEVMPDTPLLSIPGGFPLELPSESCHPDMFSYSDVFSDDLFDYRTVEIPMGLVQLLPRRNFSEVEWRSFGVCMSLGWENFDRRSCELHVLWFRRPQQCVTRCQLEKIWANEIAAERTQTSSASLYKKLEKVFIFPMFAFDRGIARRFPDAAEGEEVRNFHARVLLEAESYLRSNRLQPKPSGG